jgi:hypothetical protein
LTVVVAALFAFWAVCDYSETAPFLTEKERAHIIRRLKYQNNIQSDPEHRGVAANDDFPWPAIAAAFKDWQVWLGVVLFWSCVAPLYEISLFLPTIIKDLGYKKAQAQLMTIRIYILRAASGSLLRGARIRRRNGRRSLRAAMSLFS